VDGVGVGVGLVDEPGLVVSVGLEDWSGSASELDPALVLDDVDVEGVCVAEGESVEAGPPAVGELVGLSIEDALTDATVRVWPTRAPATALW
jgi:hypothetical protein